jgi:hypothetical protein
VCMMMGIIMAVIVLKVDVLLVCGVLMLNKEV